MAGRQLRIIKGVAGPQQRRARVSARSELARRWRPGGGDAGASPPLAGDVIPLLDGWIRRLERQAGLDRAANET